MRIFIGYSQSNIENKSTPLVCKVLSYLDTRVAAEVEIKLGWVCYAGVNGGSRRNVATCTTLKNEKQENAETSNQSTSKKEWHVQAEQNALLFIVYCFVCQKLYKSNNVDNVARDDLVRLNYL